MSASILYLNSAVAEDQPVAAGHPTLDHPLALEFRSGVIDRLVEGLEAMLANADTALLGDASLAVDDQVTAAYFDVAFIARTEGPRLTRAFARAISDGFRPLSVAGRLVPPGAGIGAATEQAKAIAQLEREFRRELDDLQGLLARLAREQSFPVAPNALSPPKLVGAFSAAMAACEVGAVGQAPLMRLYEQFLRHELGGVLDWAFDRLSERKQERFDEAPSSPPAATDAMGRLAQLAADRDGELLPGDVRLAGQLLGIVRNPAQPASATVHAVLCLVCEWMDSIANSRMTVPGLRPLFQSLCFPLIKSGLADTTLFCNPSHPVRSLLGEMATLAGMARITGEKGERRVRRMGQEVLMQFDLSPGFVTESLDRVGELDAEAQQAFREALLADAGQREQQLARRIEVHARTQLETVALAADFPPAVRAFLECDWHAARVEAITQFGADSVRCAALDKLLEQLDAQFEPNAPSADAPLSLAEALRRQFARAASRDPQVATRLEAAVDALFAERNATATAAVESKAVPAHGHSPDLIETLQALCSPGAWFRVHDHDRGVSRWMKLESLDPASDRIDFSEFDGSASQRFSLAAFTADLLSMRSEPINAAPRAQALLDRLIDGQGQLA